MISGLSITAHQILRHNCRNDRCNPCAFTVLVLPTTASTAFRQLPSSQVCRGARNHGAENVNKQATSIQNGKSRASATRDPRYDACCCNTNMSPPHARPESRRESSYLTFTPRRSTIASFDNLVVLANYEEHLREARKMVWRDRGEPAVDIHDVHECLIHGARGGLRTFLFLPVAPPASSSTRFHPPASIKVLLPSPLPSGLA